MLKAVGFKVERDQHKRVFINSTDFEPPLFTSDEASLLRRMVSMAAKKTKLHDSILDKLQAAGEAEHSAIHLLQAHLGKIIDDLQTAIKEQRKVVLLNYHSVNSNSVSDRKVDPLGFSANFQSLIAFEPASGAVKLFNTERITRVTVTRTRFERSENHVPGAIDAFGFSAGKKRYPISMLLNMRACVLMKERYPLTEFCISPDRKKDFFRFEAYVYDLKPLAHFVLGFPDDITLVESEPLKAQIRLMVKKLLDK
jgi:predicted DNA-binding transcriptional regulator YafY